MHISYLRNYTLLVQQSQASRGKNPQLVLEVLKKDSESRLLQSKLQSLQKSYKDINKLIATKKKTTGGKDPCTEEVQSLTELNQEIQSLKHRVESMKLYINSLLETLGNLVSKDVQETDLTCREFTSELALQKPEGIHFRRGRSVSGTKTPFLSGEAYLKLQNLTSYFLSCFADFETVQVPVFIHKKHRIQTDFKVGTANTSYKFSLVKSPYKSLVLMLSKENIQDLPKKYLGYCHSFHRNSQQLKIDVILVCSPEQSSDLTQNLVETMEQVTQNLKMPYKLVLVGSRRLKLQESKRYELISELKLCSCSNLTDYFSRKLEIASGFKKNRFYPHIVKGSFRIYSYLNCPVAFY